MRKYILLFLVAVLPLVTHIKYIEFPQEVLSKFHVYPVQADLFSWYKNQLLYWSTIVLAMFGVSGIPFQRCMRFYLVMVLFSSVISAFPEVVWFGMPNYMEGAVAIAAYCILFSAAAKERLDNTSFDRPLYFCTGVMFFLCALQYFNPSWFKFVTHWFVFGNHPEYQFSMETWPLFGTMMNSNILGTFAAVVYAFFLARGKTLMTFLSVLLAVGSQSRGAWIAMVLATVYLAVKYRSRRLVLPLIFFVVGVGCVYLHPTRGGMKWSAVSSGRVYVWRKTAEILYPHHLLYGNGPGAYALEFPQGDAEGKKAQGWLPETIVDRPHNFYIQVLHASGALSLVALLCLFAGFLLESKEVAINAAVLSYLVNVFFTDSCTAVAPLFWILLGTGVGRLKNFKRRS